MSSSIYQWRPSRATGRDTRDIYRWVDQLTYRDHPGPLEGTLETSVSELLNLPIEAIQGHWKQTKETSVGEILNLPIEAIQGHWKGRAAIPFTIRCRKSRKLQLEQIIAKVYFKCSFLFVTWDGDAEIPHKQVESNLTKNSRIINAYLVFKGQYGKNMITYSGHGALTMDCANGFYNTQQNVSIFIKRFKKTVPNLTDFLLPRFHFGTRIWAQCKSGYQKYGQQHF